MIPALASLKICGIVLYLLEKRTISQYSSAHNVVAQNCQYAFCWQKGLRTTSLFLR